MQYLIYGAHEETGHDTSLTIEANTENEASAKARASGILISRIEPMILPAVNSTVRPQYTGLFIAMIAFRIVALLILIGGSIWGITVCLSTDVILGIVMGVGILVGAIISACMWLFLSSLCEAIRDIARNSWR